MITLSYSGTTVTLAASPTACTVSRQWKSPRIYSAGGVAFTFNKGVDLLIHQLDCAQITDADFASLLAFVALVDGINTIFDYVDGDGTMHTARFWNAKEIQSSLVDVSKISTIMELLILN